MNIFGTPVTWLLAEVLSVVLFFITMAHASKQKNPALKIFEFFGLVIAAAIYENAGVAGNVYTYDLHRILMIGKVPLEILLFEAEIWYVAFLLTEKMRLPNWSRPFVVGLFASVQDMTMDPSAVFDLHSFAGSSLSGQWNWTMHYDGGFFGIPFFNFSGWLYMMAFYTAFVLLGRWLYEKTNKKIIGNAYPFVASILTPIAVATIFVRFLLWAYPIVPMNTRSAELVMLVINYAFPIILMFIFRNRIAGINLKDNKMLILIPIVLHIYDIVIAFALGIQQAYIPSIVVTVIHLVFFFYLKKQSECNCKSIGEGKSSKVLKK